MSLRFHLPSNYGTEAPGAWNFLTAEQKREYRQIAIKYLPTRERVLLTARACQPDPEARASKCPQSSGAHGLKSSR